MGGHRISPRFRPERAAASGALTIEAAGRLGLKTSEEAMEILEAFDATGSLRAAAELAGCDHKTVGHWVRAREEAGGGLSAPVRPRPRVDLFAAKIEEWVDRSRGKVRADVCHQKLVAMGYLGSERTTRRAIAEAKRRWRAEHGRRTRPWLPEPGLWMQWDYGDGPDVGGRGTVLFCAWLAWSRFRGGDRALGSKDAVDRDGTGPRAARVRRRADLRVDRQREDGVGRSRRGDRGSQPADRVGRPPLRAFGRDLKARSGGR